MTVAGPAGSALASGSDVVGDGQTTAVGVLSTMVAACHAAIYVASTVGGALAPLGAPAAVARQLAHDAWIAHQRLRDDLLVAIQARGASAPPAQAAYRIPAAPITVPTALLLLAQVEDSAAAAAHDATAGLTADTRRLAVDALGGMAIRAQRARLAAGLPPATATRALPGT
ncbi:DUF4439 domain-containing protein [Frankia sp. AgKG'84/4]|uniref:DUF4439 domain-containing protein n=1 Tax=Frankia sp. AgKG'84/4 TaxID=573490 RepID=UPI00200CCDB4|nr:DUF4439 domain-containing protein [Frankia sp. AgKG'84/4]MCL9794907.1 ferritin-like domain-containing protein [Frankia sp. AgKG'84/4]